MKKSMNELFQFTAIVSTLTCVGLYFSFLLMFTFLGFSSLADEIDERDIFLRSYFGYLAQSSDIIGKGVVVRSIHDEFDIRITQAMIGCTNGQVFTFWQDIDELECFPTNQSEVVVTVATNEYYFPYGNFSYFHNDIRDGIPQTFRQLPLLPCRDRCWFYADADNGEQYLYFTNALQNIRIQKNWTNYYEICRSSILSQSSRVKEDFLFSLDLLIAYSTALELQWIKNDPLLDIGVKNYIHALDAYYEMFKLDPDYRGIPPSIRDFVK